MFPLWHEYSYLQRTIHTDAVLTILNMRIKPWISKDDDWGDKCLAGTCLTIQSQTRNSKSVFFTLWLYQKTKTQGLGSQIEQVNLIPCSNSFMKEFYFIFSSYIF